MTFEQPDAQVLIMSGDKAALAPNNARNKLFKDVPLSSKAGLRNKISKEKRRSAY
jgi:hypothetical protein